MPQPTHFLHLTDLHISHPRFNDADLLSDTVATLEAVIGMIGKIAPKPAFIVVSGDLTNRGETESYRLLAQMMAAIDIPIVYALGNHDTRPGFRQGMLGRSRNPDAPYVHDLAIGGAHLIVLDTSVPGKVGGALDDRQFAFLDEALGRHADMPKIVVMHHPPALDPDALLGWESIPYGQSEELARHLRGRNVAGILSGHIHLNRVAHWHGIPIVVSTGLHNSIDVLHTAGLRVLEGTGFNLCTLRSSGLSVSFVPMPTSGRELALLPIEQVAAMS